MKWLTVVSMCIVFLMSSFTAVEAAPKKKTKSIAPKKEVYGFQEIKFGTKYDDVRSALAAKYSISRETEDKIIIGDTSKWNTGMKIFTVRNSYNVEFPLAYDVEFLFDKSIFYAFKIRRGYWPQENVFYFDKLSEGMLEKYGNPQYQASNTSFNDIHIYLGFQQKEYYIINAWTNNSAIRVFTGVGNENNQKYIFAYVTNNIADSINEAFLNQIKKESTQKKKDGPNF